jgi:L-alanine-DL-glutamate epimerase-like enolase superfamily enzyme
MRIADIEVIDLRFDYPPGGGFSYAGGVCTGRLTTLIRVTTQCRQIGWGSVYSHPELVRVIVEGHLRPMLLGADPTEVEALWQRMYRLTRWYGRKGAAMSALGGLDTAFWDLRGKAAGKPVHALLGAARTRVPAYASALLWQERVEALAEEAARHVENGFRRMKMRLGRGWDYDCAALDAVQRGVQGRAEIMVDGSMRYDLAGAERLAARLAAKGVFWFEEPFEPEDIDSFAALRARVAVPIAAGENEFGAQGFRELLRAGAIDIAQADASRCGGISEVVRVGRMAAEAGCRLAPHSWSDAIAITANAHVVAALDNAVTVEVDQTGNPFVETLLETPLRVEDGHIALTQAPGLGIEVSPAALAALTVPPGRPIGDGSYSDMAFGPRYLGGAPAPGVAAQ